jgi:hypothetical protein
VLKIDSWPQAVVITAAIVTGGAALVLLVARGADLPTIAAFIAAAFGVFAGQLATARKTSTVEAKTDQQSATLATIQEQTNGRSEQELQHVAELTALAVVAAMKQGEISSEREHPAG